MSVLTTLVCSFFFIQNRERLMVGGGDREKEGVERKERERVREKEKEKDRGL